MKSTKIFICCPADLVFAPTLAFTRFSEDLLLRYAMITAASCSAAYVDPFARTWPGFSTTDPGNVNSKYISKRASFQRKTFSISPQYLQYFAANAMKITSAGSACISAFLHSRAVAPVV